MITRTELDSVFFQRFNDGGNGVFGIATAENGKIFRQITTSHSAYIYAVQAGVGMWKKTAESGTVPGDQPAVRNKAYAYIEDFTSKIEISKDLFDDNINFWKKLASFFQMVPYFA
jgi:hypothetical protein